MAILPITHPLTPAAPAVPAAAVSPGSIPPSAVASAARVTPAVESQAARLDPDDNSLTEAMRELNARLDAWSTNLRFEIDEDTSRVVVQVVDIETGDVVRQIPSEEVLHMSKMLGKLHDLSFRASA